MRPLLGNTMVYSEFWNLTFNPRPLIKRQDSASVFFANNTFIHIINNSYSTSCNALRKPTTERKRSDMRTFILSSKLLRHGFKTFLKREIGGVPGGLS